MADAGKVIPMYQGDWVIHSSYEVLDQTTHEGSTYTAKNNITDSAITPDLDTTNWFCSSKGFVGSTLTDITADDTSGLLGLVGDTVVGQELVDEIANRVIDIPTKISDLTDDSDFVKEVKLEEFAVVVDSSTVSAINAAILNNLSNNKRTLFPRGVIEITASILIPSGAEIDFNNCTIKRSSGSGTYDLVTNSDHVSGNTNIKLYNLLLDGNKDADGYVAGASSSYGGLTFYNVSASILNNITVTGTINAEDTAGIYFESCTNVDAYSINGYNNDRTAILLKESKVRIFGSYTHDNQGSGVGSNNADECEYHDIYTHNNGYSNLSINGLRSKASNVISYGSLYSGVNIGHPENPSDDTIVQNIHSYGNTYEGITISGSSRVQVIGAEVHENVRNNIRVFQDSSNSKLLSITSRNSAGGDGIVYESGTKHSLDFTEVFNNARTGIYIGVGTNASLGANVKSYNNGQADSVNVAGVILATSYGCNLIGVECYDNQTTKTQETGIWIAGGGDHKIALNNAHDNKTYQIRETSSPTNVTYYNNTPKTKEQSDIGTNVYKQGSSVPVSGTWIRGDFLHNSTPSELGTSGSKYIISGWRCTVAGTPGTWVEQRTLTGN